jgi:Fe2+ transport system protein FeoA
MCLLEMNIGETAVVDDINLDAAVKQRLRIMGLMRDTTICIKHYGWFRSTVQIMINRTLIALRKDEACCIEVHKI